MKHKDIFADLSQNILKKRKKEAQPEFIPPMLAVLTIDYFSSESWIYEHKFDGERCLAFKLNGKVRLISRNNKIKNDQYPELVEALNKQSADNFILDGEIVAKSHGLSDFELLQGRINLKDIAYIQKKKKETPITYCIFDLLYADGYNIEALPLYARKKILKRLLKFNKILENTKFEIGNGIEFFKRACKLKWEGLIAKRFDAPYVEARSRNWLKFKCIMKQELVIAGYTDPQGSRNYFGALLVGFYENGKLRYAGKVGSGFSQETLNLLGHKFKILKTSKCPFIDYDNSTKNVHWLKPELVAEFQFAQWTKSGKLRVPRYKGLRDDKKAKDVIKEVPQN